MTKLLLEDLHQEFHDQKYSWSIGNSEIKAKYGQGVMAELMIRNPDTSNEVEFSYNVTATKDSPLNKNNIAVWIFLPTVEAVNRFPALKGSKVFVHNN